MAQTWKDVVAEKTRRQQASIPKEWILTNLPSKEHLDVISFPETCGLLSAKEIEITNSNADALMERIRSGSWSAVDVTTAFSKRAVIAHQLTNCLTEIFIDRALARAADLDEHFKKTGQVVGPFHGLPISLKDQFNIKGIESTLGYVAWIGKYAERNAVLVDILEALGAVLFVKTNVPQSLMWPETFNHVFGRTLNPHNRSLTSGGSSGGEGALVAMKGSIIGVGSDIGGSIRIPAGFCGIYALRPSYGRLPVGGTATTMEGQDSIISVFGPLAHSMGALKAFTQGVISQQPWLKDPFVHRKVWDERAYALSEHGGGKRLCFAVMWDDGHVVPHPPIIRGLDMTRKALLAAGHKVIDWKPLKHKELWAAASAIWGAAITEDIEAVIHASGEPFVTSLIPGEETITDKQPLFPKQHTSAYDVWQTQKRKGDIRQEYLEYWEASVSVTGTGRPVDAIICPVAPFTAPPHGKNRNTQYTTVWNVLDYPAVVIPVSKVDPNLDKAKPPHAFLSRTDKAHYETYTPEVYANAPIAVQIVARTLEEEALIAMSEIVDTALKAEGLARL
ncbi:amidase [Tricholoma matsutake]|nr:amidase [Tricholoma matsutake 945]